MSVSPRRLPLQKPRESPEQLGGSVGIRLHPMEIPATQSTSNSAISQHKRGASPLQQREAKRNRPRDETGNDATMNNQNAQPSTTPATTSGQEPVNTPISNKHFATFKSLRKLNSKLLTAQHHLEFLVNLREKNLIPRGLQAKPVNTGLELPPDLYELWENCHISLGSSRRDILIKHWERQQADFQKSIYEAQSRLKTQTTPEELNKINTTLDKTKEVKTTELQARRLRKAERKTADSGGENQDNQENQEDQEATTSAQAS